MSSTREHLLGYLLGALEPAEMAEVERELDNNPQLRKDLAAIEAAMFPLGFPEKEDDAALEPPPSGLIARTCEFVEDAKEDLVPARIAAAVMTDAPAGRRRARWSDVIVAASVCLAAVSLIFPAILTSRHKQQVATCTNNLRQLGISLADSAGRSPDGRIPLIPASGNRAFAGYYAVVLVNEGLLESTRYLICPSSDMAEDWDGFRIPSVAEIDRDSGESLIRKQQLAGGSYGYNIGYVENGKLVAPKHESRSHYCLMSDAPATFPDRKTRNHASRGQNLLYEDGSVRWVENPCEDLCENPFLNRHGLVDAGVDCVDVVVAESLARPSLLRVQ